MEALGTFGMALAFAQAATLAALSLCEKRNKMEKHDPLVQSVGNVGDAQLCIASTSDGHDSPLLRLTVAVREGPSVPPRTNPLLLNPAVQFDGRECASM